MGHSADRRHLAHLVERHRLETGRGFRLSRVDPGDTGGFTSKDQAAPLLAHGLERLEALQERLYASHSRALLVIFQAMDAAGKDSTIQHVMSGVNPEGCQVYSFKAPSAEELNHDFLWRTTRCLPERGRIGIFNRSYYEETLIVRVHPEMLDRQGLATRARGPKIWRQRFEDINAYERHLQRSGTVILKFFLHISKREQKKRFLARLDQKDKTWKFSADDVRERQHWKEYMRAYEDMIRHTATPGAPWHVVPADHKWVTRLIVSETIVRALDAMKLAYPTVDPRVRAQFRSARALLARE
jgi:PPK2 family polyphosphate:nucleotide phosphotransferase